MTSETSLPALLDELWQTLEAERAALLSGSSDQINASVERKTALATAIERTGPAQGEPPPGREQLGRLARFNRENSVICSAMLRYLTAALDRLRQREPHRSYGPDGAETSPPSHRPLGAA